MKDIIEEYYLSHLAKSIEHFQKQINYVKPIKEPEASNIAAKEKRKKEALTKLKKQWKHESNKRKTTKRHKKAQHWKPIDGGNV